MYIFGMFVSISWCITVHCETEPKLFDLKPYKPTLVEKLYEIHSSARMQFCNWSSEAVCVGEVDPLLIYFSDEVQFHFSGHINNQHVVFSKSRLIHKVSIQIIKAGIECAITATRTIGSPFFSEIINSERHI
jgi:hypothetical protein